MKVPLFFILIIFCVSCEKDKLETKNVPESLKNMLPYMDGQLVRYANASGYEIQAVANVTWDYVEKSSCAGCDPYVREQYVQIEFTAGSKPFMRLSADIRPHIFLSIFSPIDNYQIGAGFDFETMEGVAAPSCTAPRQKCIGTVTFNGTTYNDVLEIISGATANNSLVKAYYSVAKGVIGFQYGYGDVFSLK